VVAAIEVLGRWAAKSDAMNWTETRIPVSRGEEANAPTSLEEHRPKVLRLVEEGGPKLNYILPILDAFIAGRRPPIPRPEDALLGGPLSYAVQRCGLPSCGRTTRSDGQGDLLFCSGGCQGMEMYCCREHHRQHWEDHHKHFCQKNRRS